MNSGVYALTNTKTGEVYVGSSYNIWVRAEQHFHALETHSHHNYWLQKSYDRHPDSFAFCILETTPVENIRTREQLWIHRMRTHLLNIQMKVTL